MVVCAQLRSLDYTREGAVIPSIRFSGPSIPLIELKRAIIKQSFDSDSETDLIVVNEQTKEGLSVFRFSALFFFFFFDSWAVDPA